MELFILDGTNGVKHWVNPLKVTRVTFTPESTVTTPGVVTAEEPNPAPTVIITPASLTIHLDDGFTVQVADEAEDIVDKINKEI